MELWVLLTGHRSYPHSEMDKEVDQFCVRAHIYRCLSLFVDGLVCALLLRSLTHGGEGGILSVTPSLFNLHLPRIRPQSSRVLSSSLRSVFRLFYCPFKGWVLHTPRDFISMRQEP